MVSRRTALRLLGASVTGLAGCSSDTATPTDGHTPSRSATDSPTESPTESPTQSPTDTPSPTPTPAPPGDWTPTWSRRIGLTPLALTLDDGHLFARSQEHRLVRLAPDTGRVHWQRTFQHEVVNPPVVGGDLVLVVTDHPPVDEREQTDAQTLHALDLATGSTRWTRTIRYPLTVYGATDGTVFAFGKVKKFPGPERNPPDEGTLYALDTRTGETVWRQELSDERGGRLTDEHLLVGDGRTLRSLAFDGSTRWQFRASEPIIPPRQAHGNVYVGPENRLGFTALDPATGDVRWTEHRARVDRPQVGPNNVYVGQELFRAMEPDGSMAWSKWNVLPTWARPTETTVMVETNDELAALRPADGSPRWRWGKNRKYPSAIAATPSLVAVNYGIDDGPNFALDARTGEVRVAFDANYDVAADRERDRLYLGDAGRVFALHAQG